MRIVERRTPQWYRLDFKFTVEHVAEYLGIHKSNYSRKERNQTRFTLEEGFKLAALYKVPVQAIDFSAPEVAKNAPEASRPEAEPVTSQ